MTSVQRAALPNLVIDPGFVNHRRIQTVLGRAAMELIDAEIAKLPPDIPDWQRRVRVDHIYTESLVYLTAAWEVRTLRALLNEEKGLIFCSVERLAPVPNIYDEERVSTVVDLGDEFDFEVVLEFSTSLVVSDTNKGWLHRGHTLAMVAVLDRAEGHRLTFAPLIMGAPWLLPTKGLDEHTAMWNGWHFFELFPEDIDEFAKARDHPLPGDSERMRQVSERAVKESLAKIFGDAAPQDWGGERSDYFTSHLHVDGRTTATAFLLKGPAHFAPMSLNHLGKRNDQIFRLSQEPAELLVVQHCHDIGPAVRATLRAFAVQPGRKRKYMLMDGRETLRILDAYGLYEEALEISKQDSPT